MEKVRTIFAVSAGLFCAGCAMKPVIFPGFEESRLTLVAQKWGAITALPAISPDLNRIALSAHGGNIVLSDPTLQGEDVLYDRKADPEFQNMPPASVVNDESLLEKIQEKRKVDALLQVYKGESAAGGAVMYGLVALAGITEGMSKNLREILDLAWSPDGKKIAATVFTPYSGGTIVYVIDAAGSSRKIVRKFYPPVGNKDWKDDSEKVVYATGVSWKTNDLLVYSYFQQQDFILAERNLKDDSETEISRNKAIRAYFSPDGKKVAFFAPSGKKEKELFSDDTPLEHFFYKMDLWLADAGFEDAKRVHEGAFVRNLQLRDLRVGWSSGGDRFAYVTEESLTKNALSVYDLRKGETRKLCAGPFLSSPGFSPDNKLISFFIGLSLYQAAL